MNEMILQVLSVIGSALFMVIFFGLCVFVHELGHFLAARMCGLHVIAFSIGFKKIWAKKINGVEYRIGCLPVGGYVDLPQIDATGEALDENGNKLPKAAPWKRIVTAFAGPLFNVIFALLLGCIIWVCGLPQSSPEVTEFKVKTVQIDRPEYNAGLRPGDMIYQLNGKPFRQTWNNFSKDIMLTVGEVTLTVRRPDGTTANIVYLPEVNRQVAPSAKIPVPFFTVDLPVVIVPEKGSAAEKAGLKAGDKILRLNGNEIGLDDFLLAVRFANGQPLLLDYERMENGKKVTGTVKVIPDQDDQYAIGITYDMNQPLVVEHVQAGMPAASVLNAGDKIIAVDGKPVTKNEEVNAVVLKAKDKPVALTVLRDGQEVEVNIHATPYCYIGVGFYFTTHPTPFAQLANVLDLTWRSLKSVSAGIGRKLGVKDAGYTTLGPQHFSGPVGIGETLYKSVYQGSLIIGLNLVVMISFSLGLFNLLPIPVLDGGHILLALLEMIFRRPVSAKVLQPLTIFFAGILIAFMVFVTFFDVKRLIPVEAEARGKVITESDLCNPQKQKPSVPGQPEEKDASDAK